jgi:hypothetical protein
MIGCGACLTLGFSDHIRIVSVVVSQIAAAIGKYPI